jgi:hypothetical protein
MHHSFSPIDGTKNPEEVLGTQGMCFYLISAALSFGWNCISTIQPHGWNFEHSIVPLLMQCNFALQSYERAHSVLLFFFCLLGCYCNNCGLIHT